MSKLDSLDFRDKLVLAAYFDELVSTAGAVSPDRVVPAKWLTNAAEKLREQAVAEEKEFAESRGVWGNTYDRLIEEGAKRSKKPSDECPSCGHKLHDEFCTEDVGLYRRMQVTEDEWDIERDGAQCGCPVIGVAVSPPSEQAS